MLEHNFKVKFWIAIGIQIVVLFAVFASYQFYLATGDKVLLKLSPPRDPLSLFQGHYLVLDYEISELEKGSYFGPTNFTSGEIIYVSFSKEGNYYKVESVSREKPGDGKFIKGKVTSNYRGHIRVNYGIEEYFIPEKKAAELEHMFRSMQREEKVFVQVSLAKSGKALIDKIFIDDKELDL